METVNTQKFTKARPAGEKSESPERRTANYKPNIWNYDHMLSLKNKHEEEKYVREEKALKQKVSGMFGDLKDRVSKLQLIDDITKLSLSHYFEKEIGETVKEIASCTKSINNHPGTALDAKIVEDDLYANALFFRILRQNGYYVSQDVFRSFMDGEERFLLKSHFNTKTIDAIFEASFLTAKDECLLDNAFDKIYTEKCPLNRSVNWFNVKKHILEQNNVRPTLNRLARLSFNRIQLEHQNDLKGILRWWRKLGILKVLPFTRDRAVESFLWAIGVAYEPQYGSLRKWLTKAIILIITIDDVYDIYGSKQELEQFTNAIERWDPSEIQQLPEAIQKCFWVLYDTVNEIDLEVHNEKGWDSVLPELKKVWTDFCKALLLEANWHHNGYIPSFEEYLENGWISSSGPVLSLHALFGIGQDKNETIDVLNNSQEIIHYSSLIIRLCNDQGTSKAELARGDAPSSILCYMREANVKEEKARDHITNIINCTWKKINGTFITNCNSQQQMIKYIVNTSRVASFIYQKGDGFGVQDRETRDQVLSCLIEPIPLV